MRSVIVSAVFSLFVACSYAQQNDADWHKLQQLRPGDRIEILLKNKSKHNGTFVMLADDALTLKEGASDVGYKRDEVVRATKLGPSRRGRGALIGLAVGAGAGAAAGAGACAAGDCWVIGNGGGAAIGAVLFGAAGAGIGALLAGPKRTEIYRAP